MKHGSLILAVLILFGGVGYFLYSTPAAKAPSYDSPPGVVTDDAGDVNNKNPDESVNSGGLDITSTEPVNDALEVTSFEDCVAAGNPVMESYPRQCRHEGVLYIEEIEEPALPTDLPPAPPVACTMDAKICPDGSAVGRVGPNCEFAPCPGEQKNDEDGFVTCTPESRLAEMCTMDYTPVCGLVQVECFAPPCDPVPETFGNACGACANERVIGYTQGEGDDFEFKKAAGVYARRFLSI